MGRTVFIYGAVLAVAAFALEWLEYRYLTRLFATEIYIVLIAAGFTALGLWAGRRLTRQAPASPFARNDAALRSLGVTDREYEVLALLAEGCANKEIARRLDVSPNTIKTHVARLYEKLEVERRTQAVQKARELALIP
jgi:DNA-binding CsgD family transcriptional regulator